MRSDVVFALGLQARTLCGTPEYVAPEMISQTPYDKSVDFWALGVLFYRVVAGKFPFDGAQDRVDPATDQPIVYGNFDVIFLTVSRACLSPAPPPPQPARAVRYALPWLVMLIACSGWASNPML